MGTGLRPQRTPGWTKGQLPITAQAPQGASVLRSDQSTRGADVPADAAALLAEAGGFLAQHFAGRPGMQKERYSGGGGGNVSQPVGPAPAPKTGGGPVMGKTTPRGPTPGTF